MSIISIDQTYVASTYKRFPIEITEGKGSVVKDVNGKEYIDMGSGIGVTSFGIADEEWQQAVTCQIGKVQHMSNLYYTEPCALLAKELCDRTGMKKVFFSNSGAEANECLIKIARKYAAETKGDDCYTIVTLKNSFHGRTITTLSATGQDVFHKLFQPLTPGFESVEVGNMKELEEVASRVKIAAVLIECIQGEGGVLPLPEDYVKDLTEFTKKNDILLAVDEVQTGNGRTGELYAYMNYGIHPDIVSTAKGLAGGLPIGATLMSEKVQDVFGYGDQGSTFGGNPVSCAAALSIIRRIDDKLLAEVKKKSEYIKNELEGSEGIEGVDGMGLMLGIRTVKPASEVIAECIKNGVLPLSAKTKVRLLPALNIPMDVLEKAVKVIKEACAE